MKILAFEELGGNKIHMSDSQITSRFQGIRNKNQHGWEYIHARDLMGFLGYDKWESFLPLINKTKEQLAITGQSVGSHFVDVNKMGGIVSNTKNNIIDYKVSREACVLIAGQCDKYNQEAKHLIYKYSGGDQNC